MQKNILAAKTPLSIPSRPLCVLFSFLFGNDFTVQPIFGLNSLKPSEPKVQEENYNNYENCV